MVANQIYCPSCGAANQTEARFWYKCGGKLPELEQPWLKASGSDFITLLCPKCGGKLQVERESDQLTCQYCGLEHLVRQTGSEVILTPVVESIKRVEGKFEQIFNSSDRMAAEQTIQRLKIEMPEFEIRVKSLQEKYNREVRKKPSTFLNFILYILTVLSSLFILIVMIGTIFSEPPPKEVIFVAIGAVILFVLASSGIRIMKKKANRQPQILMIQNELEQAKKEYQQRNNQLEQLHRYTTER